jgi:putative pyruvate formate lyase activating enzyme
LAEAMLKLESIHCNNINLVTPTHVAGPIAAAIELARDDGLTLPIVYNCGGYESVETLKLLEPLIDIYMPDFKYSDPNVSKELSDADDYPTIACAAIKEMHRQKGDLQIINGVAQRGLLIRHLVLPNQLSGSFKILDFLSDEISANTHINIMGQYRPCYKADIHPHLKRLPAKEEITHIKEYAKQKGLVLVKD